MIKRLRRPNIKGGRSKRDRKLYNLYGIGEKEYLTILSNQNYGCSLCGVPRSGTNKRLSVDHNHATGKVRGVVCYVCNSAIGVVERVGLQKIKDYLGQG